MKLTDAEYLSIKKKSHEVALLAKESLKSMHSDRQVEVYLTGLLKQFALLRIDDIFNGRGA